MLTNEFHDTQQMNRNQAYLFLKFYGSMMLHHDVHINDIDPKRQRVELETRAWRRWMSYDEASQMIEALGTA